MAQNQKETLVKTYDDETLIESRVQAYREGAWNHQERRHQEWRETYSLYRDRVFVNRLTKRIS